MREEGSGSDKGGREGIQREENPFSLAVISKV